MEYLDFELKISFVGREYVVEIRSPVGEASRIMPLLDEYTWAKRYKDLQIALMRSGRELRQFSSDEQIVREFGQNLFNLLPNEIRSLYYTSLDFAKWENKGLRLKLCIQPPELAELPWEFMYDSRRADYVSLSRNTPVVRYLELPQSVGSLTVEPPLHILGLIASPTDMRPLNVESEKKVLEEATKDLRNRGLVNLMWMRGQTVYELLKTMRSGKWHVFHFIGHSGFDKEANEGFIAMVNEEGKKEPLSASKLAALLGDHEYLRLALLNSCEGAQSSEMDIFSNTATTLIRRGIPAVLVMQYKISDKAAIKFASAFYDALADGMPVDASVAEARKATYIETLEWGTPVLYMRSPDGILFNIQKPIAHPAAAKPTILPKIQEPERISAQIDELVSQFVEAKSVLDWNRVIGLGEEILKLDPNHQPIRSETAAAYRLRGESYAKTGDHDRAISNFQRAIHLDPYDADYYFLRGVSYIKKGEYDRAIRDYDRAILLDPNNADYYFKRGTIYSDKGDYNMAIVNFSEAIQLDGNKADYYYSRSLVYAIKGDHEKATADLESAIELDPKNATYYFMRGTRYADKGDYDMAIKDFDRAIQLDPNNADYYYARSLVYTNIGDFGNAAKDFERAIRLNPDTANLLLHALRQK